MKLMICDIFTKPLINIDSSTGQLKCYCRKEDLETLAIALGIRIREDKD